MTFKDPIAKARARPAGAVFHRCALQVNPHHYGATFRGKAAGGDARPHAQAIAEKAAAIGVSVLAITDHNDVSSVPAFRSAAEAFGIHVFPGFELSSSEGIHVLCIYPQGSEQHMGSIDAEPVRELVEEILEGGKEAFERRRRKYGF